MRRITTGQRDPHLFGRFAKLFDVDHFVRKSGIRAPVSDTRSSR
jgi:hypothetical protein